MAAAVWTCYRILPFSFVQILEESSMDKNINKVSLLYLHNRMSNLLPNLWYSKHGPLINQQQRPLLLGHSPDLLILNWRAKYHSFIPPNPAMVRGGLALTCSYSSQEKQWSQASWSTVGAAYGAEGHTPGAAEGVKETRGLADKTGTWKESPLWYPSGSWNTDGDWPSGAKWKRSEASLLSLTGGKNVCRSQGIRSGDREKYKEVAGFEHLRS